MVDKHSPFYMSKLGEESQPLLNPKRPPRLAQVADQAQPTADKVGDIVEANVHVAAEKTTDLAKIAVEKMPADITDKIEAVVNEPADTEGTGEKAKSTADDVGDKVKSTADSAKSKVGEVADEGKVKQAGEKARSAVDDAKSTAQDASEKAKAKVDETAENAKDVVDRAGKSVESAADDAADVAKSAAEIAQQRGDEAEKILKSAAKNIAKNVRPAADELGEQMKVRTSAPCAARPLFEQFFSDRLRSYRWIRCLDPLALLFYKSASCMKFLQTRWAQHEGRGRSFRGWICPWAAKAVRFLELVRTMVLFYFEGALKGQPEAAFSASDRDALLSISRNIAPEEAQ